MTEKLVHNAPTLRKAHMICALRSRGLSWNDIGDRMDLSRERCRRIYIEIIPVAVELLLAAGYEVKKPGEESVIATGPKVAD